MKKLALIFVLILVTVLPLVLTACSSDEATDVTVPDEPEQFRIIENYEGNNFIAFYVTEDLLCNSMQFMYEQGSISYFPSYYATRIYYSNRYYIAPCTYVYIPFPEATEQYDFTKGEITLHILVSDPHNAYMTEYAAFTFMFGQDSKLTNEKDAE